MPTYSSKTTWPANRKSYAFKETTILQTWRDYTYTLQVSFGNCWMTPAAVRDIDTFNTFPYWPKYSTFWRSCKNTDMNKVSLRTTDPKNQRKKIEHVSKTERFRYSRVEEVKILHLHLPDWEVIQLCKQGSAESLAHYWAASVHRKI